MSGSRSASRCGKRRLATMNPDFEEFFRLLTDRGVEFLLIGGVAYNYYAPPRATKDIDVWVRPSAENVRRLIAAMSEFGFPIEGVTADGLLEGN